MVWQALDRAEEWLKSRLAEKNVHRGRQLKHIVKHPLQFLAYAGQGLTGSRTLGDIGKHFGTDKCDLQHTFQLSYLDVYETYFRSLRDRDVALVEIGVREGCSLRTWKEYFPKGRIYGIDIDPNCAEIVEDRIAVAIGSQDDEEFLAHCFPGAPEFDIIIDDGSHINEHIIASFEFLFHHRLKSGGIYVIEDLKQSYRQLEKELNVSQTWPGMKYNSKPDELNNDRADFDRFILEYVKQMDHRNGNVLSVHFWSQMCIITKV